MTSITKNNFFYKHKIAGKILSAAFWLGIWQVIYWGVKQEILIVSPVRVLQRLSVLSGDSTFWIAALNSMGHVLSGFLFGLVIGVLLAVLTSASKAVNEILYPLVSMIKATPIVSFIILALVWIQSDYVPAFAAFLEIMPIVLENVKNGIAKTDGNLLQMARSYRFGLPRTVRRVYIPSVMPYFTAACTTGMGLAWKTGIAAEVLANTKLSVGGQIYDSKIYMETADLFAWTVVVIVMSVILEKLMVWLMKKVGHKYNAVT